MSSLSVSEPQRLAGVRRLSWLAMARALRGDALAAFPPEAFAQACVIQRFVGRQHILLQSPDAIRHVLVENPQNYTRDPAVLRVLRPMFGGGLFLSAGEEWRRQRRVVAPAFAPRTIHSLTAQVVEAADDFAAALKAESGHQVNLPPRLQQLALEIIGKAIFSLDMPRYGPELRSLILKYANRLARPSLTDYLLPLGLPTLADVARARFRRRWLKLVGQVIADRAARPGSGEPHDLFDVLAAPDPETGASADPESIADQVATIIVAGHETSAMALFWALYLLAQHPEAQQRIAAEVGRTGINAANAAETLPQLVFTRAVIDEVLRLYPPAFVIVRRAVADDIAAGVLIAKGSLVLISPGYCTGIAISGGRRIASTRHAFFRVLRRRSASPICRSAPAPGSASVRRSR